MSKKELFKKAVHNTKADKAVHLSDMIDAQSRNKNIIIHPALKPLIPALLLEERELLEESIRKEGVREKIVIWKQSENDYYLVDGHNRYEIVQKLKAEGISVNYAFREEQFDSLEDVKYWMVINQFSRRNLTDKQRTYLMGLRYEMEKQGYGGDRKSSAKIWLLNQETERTSERLAEEFNVSKNTIENASLFTKGIDKLNDELKADVLAGNSKINKADIQKLATLELADKIENIEELQQKIQFQAKPVVQKNKIFLKKIVKKSQHELFITITGKWLITNDLIDFWAEKRKLNKEDITELFEDKISIKEAIKLEMFTF